MIALDKGMMMMRRCERRESLCKSRLRRGRAGRVDLGRRVRLATEPRQGGGAIELYLQEIGKVRVLSPQAERGLAAKAQRGDTSAREELLKSSLRLVVTIAQEYEGLGLSLFDSIAEGNLGLMKAVARFDPEHEEQLAPLASLWIRQAIKRALANHARSGRSA
jgi:DNA-directed RNA polymerase sigma subunit (sigma70/sigma32)